MPASRRLVLVATDSKDDTIWRSVRDEDLAPVALWIDTTMNRTFSAMRVCF